MPSSTTRRAIILTAAAALLTACSSAPGASSDGTTRTLELTMTEELTFEPAQIEVRRGETVTFSVRNASGEGHEAYIGTEEEQRIHKTDHSALSAGEQAETTHMGFGVHIAPFGTGQLEYTFDDADASAFVIGCHYPGHYDAGMRAIITVSDG